MDIRLVKTSSKLKSRICAAALTVFAIVAVLFTTFHGVVNAPVELESSVGATVLGGEFYPTGEWDAQRPPKIRVKLDTGQTLLLNQTLPYRFKSGDRLYVDIWKRRFFGYKNRYRPM